MKKKELSLDYILNMAENESKERERIETALSYHNNTVISWLDYWNSLGLLNHIENEHDKIILSIFFSISYAGTLNSKFNVDVFKNNSISHIFFEIINRIFVAKHLEPIYADYENKYALMILPISSFYEKLIINVKTYFNGNDIINYHILLKLSDKENYDIVDLIIEYCNNFKLNDVYEE